MSNAQEMMLKSGTTKKFGIPIGHLDYEYINGCTDVKELEKILKILRSGDEGHYPDMERQCEERLKALHPESRSLRKDKPLTTIGQLDRDERDTIEKDLTSWTNDMIFADHDLQNKKSEFDDDSLPPIRSTGTLVNGQQYVAEQNTTSVKNKSVKPRTYAEWDKFDIDKELEKVYGGTDRSEKNTKISSQSQPLIENFIDTSSMSESEKDRKANMEKEKGNEAFRSGDYKEAITYYSRSISLQPIAASYNNRALSYLKIEEWMKAETDCNKVLQLEPENIKALLRRGTAYKGKKEFSKALSDCQKALELEPANKRAKDLIKELKKDEALYEEEQRKRKEKGRRMVIEEVDEVSSDDADEEIIVEEREEKVSVKESTTSKQQQQQKSVNKNEKNTGLDKKIVNGFHKESEIKSKTDKKDIWESDEVSEGLGKNPKEQKQEQSKISATNSVQPTQHANTEKKNSDEKEVDNLKETLDKRHADKIDNDTSENVDGSEKPADENEKGNEKELVGSEKSDMKLDQKQEINDNVVNETKEAESSSTLQRPVFIKCELPENIAQMREAGNNLFRTGQYGEAIKKYTGVIEILENIKTKDHVVNLSLIYSNRAACYLKTGDCPKAITDCEASLNLVPHAMKPLLRRAQAYEIVERFAFAYRDFKHVLQIDSTVDVALQGSTRCQRHLQQLNGARWREKLPPMTTVSLFEIPDILDSTGEPINTIVASNQPAPSPQVNIASNQSVQTSPSPPPPATSKQPEVQNTVKSEPQLTKEQMFDKEKEEGNHFVKKMDFRQAIKCYSECIDLLPDRTVSYTNRALCYLRVNEPQEAESDCNKALSVEPENIKALFRRAQAKKMLKKYKESLEDLTNLLKLDPRNSAAIRERDLVKNYWREELNALKTQMPETNLNKKKESDTKTTKASKPRKRMVIQEVESDEEEGNKSSTMASKQKSSQQEEQKSKKSDSPKSGNQIKNTAEKQSAKPVETLSGMNEKSKKNKKASEKSKSKIQEIAKDPVKQETPKSKTEAKPPSSKISTTKATKPTSMGFPTAAPSTPKLEKANPYEFIQAWNSIKSSKQIDPYADLIRQIPPSDIPKVISNKLDGQMLNIITSCVAEKFIPQGELDLSYNILSNLCKVPRFGTIAMFLSPTEQKEIKSVISKLQDTPSSAYSKDDLTRLRKEYSIK